VTSRELVEPDGKEPKLFCAEELVKGLTDKLYDDKGYLSNVLKDNLFDKGVTLITTVCKNMKAKAMSLWDREMLSSDSLSR
jgi:hypothetical protein